MAGRGEVWKKIFLRAGFVFNIGCFVHCVSEYVAEFTMVSMISRVKENVGAWVHVVHTAQHLIFVGCANIYLLIVF